MFTVCLDYGLSLNSGLHSSFGLGLDSSFSLGLVCSKLVFVKQPWNPKFSPQYAK